MQPPPQAHNTRSMLQSSVGGGNKGDSTMMPNYDREQWYSKYYDESERPQLNTDSMRQSQPAQVAGRRSYRQSSKFALEAGANSRVPSQLPQADYRHSKYDIINAGDADRVKSIKPLAADNAQRGSQVEFKPTNYAADTMKTTGTQISANYPYF